MKSATSDPQCFIVVDPIHPTDVVAGSHVVDAVHVVGTCDAVSVAGYDSRGAVACAAMVQESQREQGEVRVVAQVNKARVRVGGRGLC